MTFWYVGSKPGLPSMYVGDENPLDYYLDPEEDHEWQYQNVRCKTYLFYIGDLSDEELRNGYITITNASQVHCSENDEFGGTGPFHIARVEDKIANCDIYGHDWQTTANLVQWSSDYKTATITYYCINNKKEEPKVWKCNSVATQIAGGKGISYTITGYKGETFTKIISSNAGSAGVTRDVTINSSMLSRGKNTDADSSNDVVYPGGSKSDTIYKQSDSSIDFTIKSGYIPAGTQKLQFSFYGGKTIKDIDIRVLNSRGKIIGAGGKTMTSTYDEANGLITIPLNFNDNETLSGATVVVSGKSQTTNWSSASGTPDTAHSSIGVTKIKMFF
ncbi:MAG: hypothetical protein K6F69_06485 [Treponema sp.]|nr:hypothetical protein [Treponema sp.]